MLDLDFGHTLCHFFKHDQRGACTDWGFSGTIAEVFGIFKAYCTRVGSGPFLPSSKMKQENS
jgi:adenylosuccinate synthase